MSEENPKIILYQTEDGKTKIDVKLDDETVWLTQGQMVKLFQKSKQNISLHIKNIFSDGELEEASVVKEYLTTAQDGKRYKTKYFNLDVVISVGYRVKSHRGTQFRIWATQKLKEYLIKGFVINDERLEEGRTTQNYFDELFERVRRIWKTLTVTKLKCLNRDLQDYRITGITWNDYRGSNHMGGLQELFKPA
jgi:hypothetical protein